MLVMGVCEEGEWMCGGVGEVELERAEGERVGGTECLLELGQRADNCELRIKQGW